MTLKMRLLLLFSLFALLLVGTWLYTTPAYTVRQVAITVSGGPEAIPEQARQLLSTQVGTQLLRLRTGEIASQLKTLATIEDVQVGRRFPNTLTAHLDLVESPVVIHASDEDVYYLIKEGKLVGLSKADAALYTKSAVTVEIPASYAQMMVRWGVDRLFGQVVELARDLDSESSLITRVKYDNNSSNSFGKMVLELSSLNAQIWVREPVGAARVEAAVALVQKDRADSLYFLDPETKRYDLYRQGLVRR
ncbi:MAG: FtsQ-type POTRA domain-containing protein [Sphaerochaeta sp.]|jgi:hypothetical protein